MTVRSPPRRLYAAKVVNLLYTCPIYILLIFSIGSKTTTGRRCGGGESSSKFSSFCYVYYAYTLYKPPLL